VKVSFSFNCRLNTFLNLNLPKSEFSLASENSKKTTIKPIVTTLKAAFKFQPNFLKNAPVFSLIFSYLNGDFAYENYLKHLKKNHPLLLANSA
jgi:hypothetical protein